MNYPLPPAGRRRILAASVAMLGLAALPPALHASEERPEPLGVSAPVQPLDSVERRVMPPINVEKLLAEDARAKADEAPRFAATHDVTITPAKAGTWETMGDMLLWRLRISSPGAQSINLGFTRYVMPAGGHLAVYPAGYTLGEDRDGSLVRWFTDADNETHQQLWTPIVPGDDVVIEVAVPKAAREQLQLKLRYVNHAYRGFGSTVGLKSGSCNVDVACPEGDAYRDQIRAVGTISRGGSRFCSGSLINNVGAKKPFFITADHCGVRANNAASLVVYWNFQNSRCRPVGSPESGRAGDGQLNQFNTGAFFRATWPTSDFTLVELDDAPAEAFNVYLAGWNRSAGPFNDGAVGIHHPNVDEKRISFSNTATRDDNGTHHRVQWRPGIGVTEPGSSGSPIYSKQGLFIGQLTGGASACGVADSAMWDIYGKFSRSWNGGGAAGNRVRDHLDPNNTAPMTLQGRNWNDGGDTVPPTAAIDSPADGATVSGTVAVTASADDNVGVVRVDLQVDGAVIASDTTAPYSFSWNTASVADGAHVLQVTAHDAAGNTGPSAKVTVTVANGGGNPAVVFEDDFETNKGWTPNPGGTDTATTGRLERGDPQATTSNGPKQLGDAVSGLNDLVTGRLAGANASANDVDGGMTSIRSPQIALPATGSLTLSFSFYVAHHATSSAEDFLRVRVVGATTTTVFDKRGSAADVDGAWQSASVSLDEHRGETVQLLVEAGDMASPSLFEAAIDDVKITRQ